MEKVRGMYLKVRENGGAHIVVRNGYSWFKLFVLSYIDKNKFSLRINYPIFANPFFLIEGKLAFHLFFRVPKGKDFNH